MMRPVLALMAISVAASAQCPPSCYLATTTPIDPTNNQALLQTVFPGEYAVPGTNLLLTLSGPASAGRPAVLACALNLLGTPQAPGAPFAGSLLVDPSSLIALAPVQPPANANPFWGFFVPNVPCLTGADFYLQGAYDYAAGGGLYPLTNALHLSIGSYLSRIVIGSIAGPSSIVSGSGSSIWTVALTNTGNAPTVPFPLTVGVGPNANTIGVSPIAAGASATVQVDVPNPAFACLCGGSITMPVIATAQHPNCGAGSFPSASTSTSVHCGYWDLSLQITSAPTVGHRQCGNPPYSSTSWTVRVTNVGTISSPPSCARSAISINTLAGQNGNVWVLSNLIQNVCGSGPIQFWNNIPSLAPGASVSHTFSMCLSCAATIGTQHILADIAPNCPDACGGNNNSDERLISIQ